MSESHAEFSVLNYLPVYGSISTGLSHTGVGIIAMLSFLKVRDGGADESSMLAILNEAMIGKIVLWVIMIGTACYMVLADI